MQKSLYLLSSGRLKRKENTICIETEQGTKYFPIEGIRDIYVFGEVDLNKRLLEFLEEHEVLVHFFNHYGGYTGTFYPREHYNSGYMILQQALHYRDKDKRFELASAFVRGSLENLRQVLKYYENRGHTVERALSTVESDLSRIELCSTVEELLAAEGHARDAYYESFNEILGDGFFRFDKRTRRPPLDPVNVLISFGNSLVYTKVLSEIYKTHLDPRIGFLHSTNFRRLTLNLDVAEVFKPVLADRTLFTVVGRRMVSKSDFEDVGGLPVLKESGKRAYLEEFERKLATTIRHRRLNRQVSYQTILRLELYKLEKHLMGEERFEPFVSKW